MSDPDYTQGATERLSAYLPSLSYIASFSVKRSCISAHPSGTIRPKFQVPKTCIGH